MRMDPGRIVTSALSILVLTDPAAAGMQWTQSTRTIGGEVIVTNATEFALDIDNQSNTVLGPFVAATFVDTTVTGVSGSAAAQQDSDLSPTRMTGSGAFQTATDVTDPAGIADVFGRSQFTGYFDLDSPTPFSLIGQLTSGGVGTTAQLALIGPGGAVVDVLGSPGVTVPVNASGTLAPGSYLVLVNVAGNAQEAPPDPPIEASGDWEMDFLVGGATSAPEAAPVAGFRVHPNPTRGRITISPAPGSSLPRRLSVHDAAGRLVRTLDVGPAAATWDTRDGSGAPVSAGVYFVTRGRGGRFATEKIVVLR